MRNTGGFTHCGNTEQSSASACGFREVRDAIVVWIGDGRRVTVHRNGFLELLGLITCGVRGIGQVAILLAARVGVRMTRAFGSGKARESSGPAGFAVRKQQGRVRHENGEGEMERKNACDNLSKDS